MNEKEKMIILAFLQNQWFKNPERVRQMFLRHPDKRNDLIKHLLFYESLTGRRLLESFGSPLCNQIIWEEASPILGNYSGSSFRASLDHIEAAIKKFRPDIVLCFGKIAGNALRQLDNSNCVYFESSPKIIYLPHPASRTNPVPELRRIAQMLEQEFVAKNK